MEHLNNILQDSVQSVRQLSFAPTNHQMTIFLYHNEDTAKKCLHHSRQCSTAGFFSPTQEESE